MKKPSLIVIDDETDILENYQTLFEESYNVVTYDNPAKFLAAVRSTGFKAPDALITDLTMPGMNGLEMIKRVHSMGVFFPFILLTGNLDKDAAVVAINQGVFKILEKPTDFHVLNSAIDQIIIDHEIYLVRNEIRQITKQLRELYSGLRVSLMQYIPEDVIDQMIVDAPEGHVQKKMSFEDLLDVLEVRLDRLLKSETFLNEMQQDKVKAS